MTLTTQTSKGGLFKNTSFWDFPGVLAKSSLVKIPCFHCRGPGFHSWSGNWDPACCDQKKKKINKSTSFSVCHTRCDSHAKILVALLIQIPGGPLGHPKEYDLDVTYGPD